MARSKPAIVRLRDLEPGQSADFFALLAERAKGATRDGKPFYTCRFRDGNRTATAMIWATAAGSPTVSRSGSSASATRSGPSTASTSATGRRSRSCKSAPPPTPTATTAFDPVEFVERSRFDASAMFDELRKLVEGEVADEPLRRLVLLLLDRHAEALKRLPGRPGTTTRSPAAGWSTPWR